MNERGCDGLQQSVKGTPVGPRCREERIFGYDARTNESISKRFHTPQGKQRQFGLAWFLPCMTPMALHQQRHQGIMIRSMYDQLCSFSGVLGEGASFAWTALALATARRRCCRPPTGCPKTARMGSELTCQARCGSGWSCPT